MVMIIIQEREADLNQGSSSGYKVVDKTLEKLTDNFSCLDRGIS